MCDKIKLDMLKRKLADWNGHGKRINLGLQIPVWLHVLEKNVYSHGQQNLPSNVALTINGQEASEADVAALAERHPTGPFPPVKPKTAIAEPWAWHSSERQVMFASDIPKVIQNSALKTSLEACLIGGLD